MVQPLMPTLPQTLGERGLDRRFCNQPMVIHWTPYRTRGNITWALIVDCVANVMNLVNVLWLTGRKILRNIVRCSFFTQMTSPGKNGYESSFEYTFDHWPQVSIQSAAVQAIDEILHRRGHLSLIAGQPLHPLPKSNVAPPSKKVKRPSHANDPMTSSSRNQPLSVPRQNTSSSKAELQRAESSKQASSAQTSQSVVYTPMEWLSHSPCGLKKVRYRAELLTSEEFHTISSIGPILQPKIQCQRSAAILSLKPNLKRCRHPEINSTPPPSFTLNPLYSILVKYLIVTK